MRDAVAEGAALLDQARPGWWSEIRLKKLDLSVEDRCVLGQVFGNYFDGLAALELSDGRSNGFDGADTDDLAQRWKAEVLDRKFL